jgi:hypothetical protein
MQHQVLLRAYTPGGYRLSYHRLILAATDAQHLYAAPSHLVCIISGYHPTHRAGVRGASTTRFVSQAAHQQEAISYMSDRTECVCSTKSFGSTAITIPGACEGGEHDPVLEGQAAHPQGGHQVAGGGAGHGC